MMSDKLREAAEKALKAMREIGCGLSIEDENMLSDARVALRTALEREGQEPVALGWVKPVEFPVDYDGDIMEVRLKFSESKMEGSVPVYNLWTAPHDKDAMERNGFTAEMLEKIKARKEAEKTYGFHDNHGKAGAACIVVEGKDE